MNEIFKGDLIAKEGKVYQYEKVTGYVNGSSVQNFAETFPRLKSIGGDLYLGKLCLMYVKIVTNTIPQIVICNRCQEADRIKNYRNIGEMGYQ